MAFSSKLGFDTDISKIALDPKSAILDFNPGAIIQFKKADRFLIERAISDCDAENEFKFIGSVKSKFNAKILWEDKLIYSTELEQAMRIWLREITLNHDHKPLRIDNLTNPANKGIKTLLTPNFKHMSVNFKTKKKAALLSVTMHKPRLNLIETLEKYNFEVIQITIRDILNNHLSLNGIDWLIMPESSHSKEINGPGFIHKNLIKDNKAADALLNYMDNKNNLILSMSLWYHILREIPGSPCYRWPIAHKNKVQAPGPFWTLVKCNNNPSSKLLQGFDESVIPVMFYDTHSSIKISDTNNLITDLTFVNSNYNEAKIYPFNPNSDYANCASISNENGNFTSLFIRPDYSLRVENTPDFDLSMNISPWEKIISNAADLLE